MNTYELKMTADYRDMGKIMSVFLDGATSVLTSENELSNIKSDWGYVDGSDADQQEAIVSFETMKLTVASMASFVDEFPNVDISFRLLGAVND